MMTHRRRPWSSRPPPPRGCCLCEALVFLFASFTMLSLRTLHKLQVKCFVLSMPGGFLKLLGRRSAAQSHKAPKLLRRDITRTANSEPSSSLRSGGACDVR